MDWTDGYGLMRHMHTWMDTVALVRISVEDRQDEIRITSLPHTSVFRFRFLEKKDGIESGSGGVV